MYIKILSGTPLFDKLTILKDKMYDYDQAALDWAKYQGATNIRGGWWEIAGGISTATFPNKPPASWIKAGPKFDDNEYVPGKSTAGKEVQKAIDGLKKITYEEFNKIFGYDHRKHTTNKRSFHPGFVWYPDCVLMDFADHTVYEPIEDMVEITVTEYKKIVAQNPERSVATVA